MASMSPMATPTLRLSAGDLPRRFVLQSRAETPAVDGAIVSVWSSFAAAWGAKRSAGFVEQLASEQGEKRRAWEITIRRRSTPLPVPLRILDGTTTMFALGAVDDDVFRDRTVLSCVEGIDMSLAESVTLYRGTDVVQTDRSTLRTWASVATAVPVRLDEADTALTQRLFGQERTADVHGTVELDADIRVGDGLALTSGRHVGQRFLVAHRVIDPRLPAQAYFTLALVRTEEAFA